jgi:heat shock protein HtpX
MMFASVLPAVFYYLGYSMMMSSWYGGGRQREEGGGAAPLLIGIVSMAIYWILTLFVLSLSRLREYYADATSASVVDDGPRKLSEALAKIVASTGKLKRYRSGTGNLNAFKALFIEDPDSAERDQMAMANTRMFKTDQQLVQEIISRRIRTTDRLIELLSTHPNIVKRLQALQNLS